MKVKVLRRFNDKHENVIHAVGKVIEVTEERYKEILSVEGEPIVEILKIEGQDPPRQQELPIDLAGTVDEVKEALEDGFEKETLELILKAEQEGENRKGVTKYVESLLKVDDK